MIVKIFPAVKGFPGVRYNTNKLDNGQGVLMKVANFGALQAMGNLRPQDYQDYLMSLAALNKRVVHPQLHATISAKGKHVSGKELTVVAEQWLEAMGYGKQPYLVVFHKDTDNHHVHVVSCRVDREGKKINSAYEHVRAIRALNKIVGLDENTSAQKDLKDALGYRFSTRAQFALILEGRGYVVRDNDLIKFGKKQTVMPALVFKPPDKQRAYQLRAIFEKYRKQYATELRPNVVKLADGRIKEGKGFTSVLSEFLRSKFGFELVFHASGDKPPYGYTVIDHAQKNVFKGGEVLSLKDLLSAEILVEEVSFIEPIARESGPAYVVPINIFIADDVDDQQIHGMRRRRQRKARTNTR